MRAFWTIFFLGSLLLVGVDVVGRRQMTDGVPTPPTVNDPTGFPTPNP